MGAIDETGNKYGKLTVLQRDYSKKGSQKNAYWLCKCDCGNTTIVIGSKLRNGETRSCGCLRIEAAKKQCLDLVGQKFGRLLVLERDGSSNTGLAKWKCQCDCGNIVSVFGSNLRSGHTTSCGCLLSEINNIRAAQKFDITGQRFGKLVAISRLDTKRGTNHLWKCICDCGNECEVDINSLTQNRTLSCGCSHQSRGELLIEQLLKDNNILYEKEKSFDSCRSPITNSMYRFDFYINNQYFIEFDGIQHFEGREYFGGEKQLQENQKNDEIKNNWCIKNNIPLIRIPYTHLNDIKIEDLLLETSQYIYKGDK